ncbi:MAG: hypothetical protein PHQ04_04425 [Opitutaceae bacterium]|nr:hypothetical protein [Opitutaceae bacterium]
MFNNNGTWWLHCTLHLSDHTKSRFRESLGTSDLAVARERRDDALFHLRLHAEMIQPLTSMSAMGRAA